MLKKRRDTGVNFSFNKREIAILTTLLAASFIIRLLLFPQKGYPIDTNDFLSWFSTAAVHGIRPFYQNSGWTDYPPFNVYIFWLFGTIANAATTAGINAINIVKLTPNIFDLGTATLIYVFIRKQSSFKLALVATALYAFNPAVIFNAAVWGQFDATYTFFLVLSLMLALKKRPNLSAAAFAIGLLTKPQGIALAPLIAFLIYKKNGLKQMLISIAIFTVTIFVVIAPFNWGGSPITFLTNIYFGGYKEYAYTSVNAFNLWGGLTGMWVSDGNLFIVGWILFGAFTVFTLYFLNKRYGTASNEFIAVFAAFMLFFAFFMLPTRIHERYLFPAISVLALMFPFIKRARPLYAVITATLLINEGYVLYLLNKYYPNAGPNLTGDPVVLAVSAINILMLAYASIILWDKHTWLKPQSTPHESITTYAVNPPNQGDIDSGQPIPPEPTETNTLKQTNQGWENLEDLDSVPPIKPKTTTTYTIKPTKPRWRNLMKLDSGIHVTKKDIITIILLSIVFLGMASWNVGSIQYPTTNWQTTTQANFYVNLGSNQSVQTVIFWVKSGNATVNVYSGTPENWTSQGEFALQPSGTDYSVFQTHDVNTNTQYLGFQVNATQYDSRPMFANSGIENPTDQQPTPIIQISEIGIESQSNQQIPILNITPTNITDPTLNKLIDEQHKLQIPPDYMSKMYFDEVYFARAAENYLHGQIPNERTHPPLGKLIQAAGIAIFTDTPFGWRIMGVIFATLMIPLIYVLGKKLFGTWIGGFSAAFLLSFDFMHFTMARIGTADTYVVFFSLLSQLFFLIYFVNVIKNGWRTSVIPLFLAVIFFALGFSTKWFTLFGALGLLALLVALRLRDIIKLKGSLSDKYLAFFDYPAFLLLGFILIAVLIYFLTYIPEMLAGDSFLTILKLQNSMLSFHTGLSATDSFASPWWSWPLMFRPNGYVPRWFDITYLPNNVVSTISVFGNPAIWWIGFTCIILLTIKVIEETGLPKKLWKRITQKKPASQTVGATRKWDLPAIYIIVILFFSWLPYILISRVTYIYHFYLSVPLVCLAATYFINRYWNTKKGKIATIAFFAIVVAMFIIFYPVISGMPVARSYIDNNLKWFPSWYFAP